LFCYCKYSERWLASPNCNLCIYVCEQNRDLVCMYVRMCIYIYIYTHTHAPRGTDTSWSRSWSRYGPARTAGGPCRFSESRSLRVTVPSQFDHVCVFPQRQQWQARAGCISPLRRTRQARARRGLGWEPGCRRSAGSACSSSAMRESTLTTCWQHSSWALHMVSRHCAIGRSASCGRPGRGSAPSTAKRHCRRLLAAMSSRHSSENRPTLTQLCASSRSLGQWSTDRLGTSRALSRCSRTRACRRRRSAMPTRSESRHNQLAGALGSGAAARSARGVQKLRSQLSGWQSTTGFSTRPASGAALKHASTHAAEDSRAIVLTHARASRGWGMCANYLASALASYPCPPARAGVPSVTVRCRFTAMRCLPRAWCTARHILRAGDSSNPRPLPPHHAAPKASPPPHPPPPSPPLP